MAQHDFVIDGNQPFPAYGSDLNSALLALATNNSGTTQPVITYAHQIWLDTSVTPNLVKMRNAGNTAWVTLGSLSTNLGLPSTADVNGLIASSITASATEPVSPVANQIWIDSSVNPSVIKVRSQSNDAWVTIGTVANNFGITPTSIGSCFHAQRITTAQSITNNTLTTVVFNGEVTDTHDQFNTATGIFTCSVPGFYNFSTNVRLIVTGTTFTSVTLGFLRNGNLEIRGSEYAAAFTGTVVNLSMSYGSFFTSGDTLAVRVRSISANASASSIAAQISTLESAHFSGARVG